MTFSVCARCGHLQAWGWMHCPKCHALQSAYSGLDLDRAIELRQSIRDARRALSRDDADTVGEVCAAYNRLDERVAKLEAALAPILARGLHSVKA